MSTPVDETRRDFLLRLARAGAFVPPALLTLEVGSALGQGKGSGATTAPGQQQFGGLSPAARIESPITSDQIRADPAEPARPWDPGQATGSPPWSQPPPTQGGPGIRR